MASKRPRAAGAGNIHTLADWLHENLTEASERLGSKIDTVVYNSSTIIDVAAGLIEPFMGGIGPRPPFTHLNVKTCRGMISSPAYFSEEAGTGRTQIMIQNLEAIQDSMGPMLRMIGLPLLDASKLWIMMAIIFCHELAHAWVYYSCPAGARNPCNSEAFATFVATQMSAREGVTELNQVGMNLLGKLNDMLHAAGKLDDRPVSFYQKCYVRASQTELQDLRAMTCSQLNGADIKYGGHKKTQAK